jgi:RNA polymerase sigma factor (sigma-70 family)
MILSGKTYFKPELSSTSDEKWLVAQIINGDNQLAFIYLKKNCAKTFEYIRNTRLRDLVLDVDDLINDFYIYLQENNWEKLRYFRFESKLQTWINLVASRYLLKKYDKELKENSIKGTPIEDIKTFSDEDIHNKIVRVELLEAISHLKEKRYKHVLLLGIYGFEPKEIGVIIGTTTNNVYVIKSRAIEQLKNLINE